MIKIIEYSDGNNVYDNELPEDDVNKLKNIVFSLKSKMEELKINIIPIDSIIIFGCMVVQRNT